ncbi:DUF3847 domain-containing protein [Eubacterium sp. MSJ-21]|nr:DUF3847 domain-containing protein [Eubacterium sp. MSJ-21]
MKTKEGLEALQKKHREQMQSNRDRVQERKTRAHRLIVRGILAENAVGEDSAHMTDEEFKAAFYELIRK